ncbi:MAG: LutC/YkgG family protein [Actinomycetota bacterium]
MEKARFLNRLPGGPPTDLPWDAASILNIELPQTDLTELFRQRLTSVDGRVHGPVVAEAVPELVFRLLGEGGANDYLGWDELGVPAIHDRLVRGGILRVGHMTPLDATERLVHHQTYQQVGAGITGVDAGLAETGSIVLRSGPGRPRMASLIPPIHIALLPVDRVFRSLAHFAAEETLAGDGSNLVVITGPSRTGDIEQQLNLGVHGPKYLHAILVIR